VTGSANDYYSNEMTLCNESSNENDINEILKMSVQLMLSCLMAGMWPAGLLKAGSCNKQLNSNNGSSQLS